VAIDGASRLTLGLLGVEDAIALLVSIVGADRIANEPDAARELTRLCGYLPLALRIAAERVSAHQSFSLADTVDELADQNRLDLLVSDDDENAAVRAIFSWSYHALKPEPARAFRLVGLHPGAEFSGAAAAALLGVPLAQARRLLDSLAGMHLLEDAGRDRYPPT